MMSRTQIIKADVEHPGIYASVNLNGFVLASEERPAAHAEVILGYRVPHIPEVWFGIGYRDGDRYWLGPRGLDPHYAQLNADQVVIWKAIDWPFQFDEGRADTSTYLQYRYIVGEGPWDTEEHAKDEWERLRNASVQEVPRG